MSSDVSAAAGFAGTSSPARHRPSAPRTGQCRRDVLGRIVDAACKHACLLQQLWRTALDHLVPRGHLRPFLHRRSRVIGRQTFWPPAWREQQPVCRHGRHWGNSWSGARGNWPWLWRGERISVRILAFCLCRFGSVMSHVMPESHFFTDDGSNPNAAVACVSKLGLTVVSSAESPAFCAKIPNAAQVPPLP